MKIKKIEVGYLKCNCYILVQDNKTLIIDPGDDFDKIDSAIEGEVVGIIITHYHFDHIGAMDSLVNKYNIKVYDINNLKEGNNTIDNFNFQMIKTPGHKEDLISILFENKLFCGDFIFEGSIGRIDLPGSSPKDMKNSLSKITKLNKDTIIYPGHGNETTLEKELPNLLMYEKILNKV